MNDKNENNKIQELSDEQLKKVSGGNNSPECEKEVAVCNAILDYKQKNKCLNDLILKGCGESTGKLRRWGEYER